MPAVATIEGREEWSVKAEQHFTDIFGQNNPDVEHWRTTMRKSIDDHNFLILFDDEEVRVALESLNDNKSCAEDLIVSEMLKALDDRNLHLLSTAFTFRARRLAVAPEAWHHLVTTLFPKVPRAEQPGQFRPICLLPALMKAYLKLLFIRMRDQIEAALH
eukprot:7110096-Heterocapsa_arctica.AAC.1